MPVLLTCSAGRVHVAPALSQWHAERTDTPTCKHPSTNKQPTSKQASKQATNPRHMMAASSPPTTTGRPALVHHRRVRGSRNVGGGHPRPGRVHCGHEAHQGRKHGGGEPSVGGGAGAGQPAQARPPRRTTVAARCSGPVVATRFGGGGCAEGCGVAGRAGAGLPAIPLTRARLAHLPHPAPLPGRRPARCARLCQLVTGCTLPDWDWAPWAFILCMLSSPTTTGVAALGHPLPGDRSPPPSTPHPAVPRTNTPSATHPV